MSVFSEILGKLPQSLTEQSASSSVVAASRDPAQISPLASGPPSAEGSGPWEDKTQQAKGWWRAEAGDVPIPQKRDLCTFAV